MTSSENWKNTDIGFMGAGGIASALATGFCRAPEFTGKIYMYNPHAEKVERLERLFPGRIVQAKSNQEVADRAILIIPALLPAVLREVAPAVRFRPCSHIVHIAAGIKIAEAADWYAPACNVVRAVPLPFAADRMGPLVMCGGDELAVSLFSLVGTPVVTETERELEILAAVTGMMVPYYATVGETVKWAVEKGCKFRGALDYTTSMNETLSCMMRNKCSEDIEAFLVENSTPHGTNEMGLKTLREAGVYDAWHKALEKIGKRYGL